MPYVDYVSYFVGGVVFANGLPHLIRGITGMPFQSPFGKPPGKGLSSSSSNTCWGMLNVAAAYMLTFHVGDFDVRNTFDAGAFGGGMLVMSLMAARYFGRFHGGNLSGRPAADR